MADTAIENLSNFMREELPKVMHESLPLVAPFFKDIVATAVGVNRDESSQIGRTWKVIHLYDAGISGLMKYGDPLGPAMVAGTTTGKMAQMLQFYTAASSTPFPTATESPHAGSLKRELSLHYNTGNFSVPVAWMQADALSATQIKSVVRDIKAVGKLRAMIEATGMHSIPIDDANSLPVKVLGSVTSVSDSSNVVTVTLDEAYGTIHNFRPGQMIDFVDNSAGTAGGQIEAGTALDGTDILNTDGTNKIHVMVTSVDYLGRTFKCVGIGSDDGLIQAYDTTHGWTAAGSLAIAQYDYIVTAGCSQFTSATAAARPMPTWGFEDWIKSSGTIMGGAAAAEALDLDTYTQFKSSVTAVNGPLTEDVLNKYVGEYMDAYPGESVDTLITTNGVTQKHLQQFGLYNNRQFYDRQGKSLSAKAGWSEVNYEFNGRTVRWIVDPLCVKNRLYAVKLQGGNIKRYVPPTISAGDARLNQSAGLDGEIQFLAPAGGHTGIFMVARGSSGQVLDILEAPFWQYQLIAPIDPRGIKLTGLTEA
jgi:hypothetical protein